MNEKRHVVGDHMPQNLRPKPAQPQKPVQAPTPAKPK